MDIKERILNSALELYNRDGISAVTTRHIAAAMSISPGNLHYHFTYTEDILKALYERLLTEFNVYVSELENIHSIDFQAISSFSENCFRLVCRFKFIFLHFVELANRIPAIRESYQELTFRREREFKNVFIKLVQNGTFRSDIPDAIWSNVVTQIFILGDFWLSFNELTGRLSEEEAVSYYNGVFNALFFPYLTSSPETIK